MKHLIALTLTVFFAAFLTVEKTAAQCVIPYTPESAFSFHGVNYVKIPEGCTITLDSMQGTLVTHNNYEYSITLYKFQDEISFNGVAAYMKIPWLDKNKGSEGTKLPLGPDDMAELAQEIKEIVIPITVPEEPQKVITDADILKMNIFEACKTLGVNPEYNKRYENIVLPLCDAGIVLFDGSMNPYVDGSDEGHLKEGLGDRWNCYSYIGTGPQNQKLIRNLVANKHLIENGTIAEANAKKWKIVK